MGGWVAGSRRVRWGQALFLSSISAWVFYIVYALLAAGFETYWQACGRAGMLAFTLALAILGFPIALVICLLMGGPALWAAELLKLTKWWQAALLGALGGILALLLAPMMFGPAVGFEFDLRTVLSLAVLSPAGACAGVTAWGSLWLDGKYRREAVKGAEREADWQETEHGLAVSHGRFPHLLAGARQFAADSDGGLPSRWQ